MAAMDDVARGREASQHHPWQAADQAFSLADEAAPLDAGDLELLARRRHGVGLRWLRCEASSVLAGVGADAAHIVEHITTRREKGVPR